ncbi:peroxiredoxin [Chlamydiifrater phoenicopteri]|uniref:peroxiredoxin n=1 Tax=Chlamydiifrater phoenicopteri TaxID=2681469 RepID=UPI001BCF2011|nr:peroxiredoxin [Chlamydiifrater phoenicopteri]
MKSLVGNEAPSFIAKAVVDGEVKTISLESYRGKNVVLFFYPKDFTFVCPTELHAFQDALPAFEERNSVVLGCSVDDEETHKRWLATPKKEGGIIGISYPLISDVSREISQKYGVLHEQENLSYRGLFLIDKAGVIRHAVINDLPLGRSVDEELRVLDALLFFEQNGMVCPANWKQGSKAMVPNDEGLKEYFSTID